MSTLGLFKQRIEEHKTVLLLMQSLSPSESQQNTLEALSKIKEIILVLEVVTLVKQRENCISAISLVINEARVKISNNSFNGDIAEQMITPILDNLTEMLNILQQESQQSQLSLNPSSGYYDLKYALSNCGMFNKQQEISSNRRSDEIFTDALNRIATFIKTTCSYGYASNCYIAINTPSSTALDDQAVTHKKPHEHKLIHKFINTLEEHLKLAGFCCASTINKFMENPENAESMIEMIATSSSYQVIIPIILLYLDPIELYRISQNPTIKIYFIVLSEVSNDFFTEIRKYIQNFTVIDWRTCSYTEGLRILIENMLSIAKSNVEDYMSIWNTYDEQFNSQNLEELCLLSYNNSPATPAPLHFSMRATTSRADLFPGSQTTENSHELNIGTESTNSDSQCGSLSNVPESYIKRSNTTAIRCGLPTN